MKARPEKDIFGWVSLEQFKQIVFQACVFCNEFGKPRGIDRKNNFEPYVPEIAKRVVLAATDTRAVDPESIFLDTSAGYSQHQKTLRLKSEIDRGGTAGPVFAPSPVDLSANNL